MDISPAFLKQLFMEIPKTAASRKKWLSTFVGFAVVVSLFTVISYHGTREGERVQQESALQSLETFENVGAANLLDLLPNEVDTRRLIKRTSKPSDRRPATRPAKTSTAKTPSRASYKSSEPSLANDETLAAENELQALSWPLATLHSCSKPGAGSLFSRCRKCGLAPRSTPSATSPNPSSYETTPEATPGAAHDSKKHPDSKPKCYCGRVSLASAGSSDAQQHCLNYVRQLNDPDEISLDSERECGTTHCAQTFDDDHRHSNECSFPILVTEMPTHVRGKGAENDATKMQKMRHTSAMPVFCSGQQALQER